MRNTLSFVGVILIIVGVLFLAYQGITYTKREKVAQIGSLEVTTDQQKTVTFPPMLGGLSLAAGLVLVVISRLKK